MKLIKILFGVLMMLLLGSSISVAAGFGWTKDFNIKANLDPSGFRARLATRFKLAGTEVEAVISNFKDPAEAYIACRLGEMSGHSPSYVVETYNKSKGKGWGSLAKSLGIKPGSAEFHALKRGHDLYDAKPQRKGKGKRKGKK